MATKEQFMIRLKKMVDHVKKSKASIEVFCPARKDVARPYENQSELAFNDNFCPICREVMTVDKFNFLHRCPCGKYGNKALKIAEDVIEKWERNKG